MGILILQKNNGKDWVLKLRENWSYLTRDGFDKARDFLDTNFIPYSVSFGFETYLIDLNNEVSQKTFSSFAEMKKILIKLLELKDVGVNVENFDKKNLEHFTIKDD